MGLADNFAARKLATKTRKEPDTLFGGTLGKQPNLHSSRISKRPEPDAGILACPVQRGMPNNELFLSNHNIGVLSISAVGSITDSGNSVACQKTRPLNKSVS